MRIDTKTLLYSACTCFLLVISVISVASFFGFVNDGLELLSHLRPVFLILAMFATLLLIVLRRLIWAIAGVIVVVLNAVPIVDLYTAPPPAAVVNQGAPRIRLLQMNLWGGKNHDYKRAISTIHELQPDVVGLSEITAGWLLQLKKGLPDYPFQVAEPSHGGICVLSRLPLSDGKVEYYGAIKRPRVFTRVKLGDRRVTLIFAHPVIPLGKAPIRNGEFVELARETSAEVNPTVLAGDLNCTPWSYYFGKLKADGLLHDSEKGFGFQPSWCVFWGFTLFPIDHCLMTADVETLSRRLGPPIGSDHLPVITDLIVVGKH